MSVLPESGFYNASQFEILAIAYVAVFLVAAVIVGLINWRGKQLYAASVSKRDECVMEIFSRHLNELSDSFRDYSCMGRATISFGLNRLMSWGGPMEEDDPTYFVSTHEIPIVNSKAFTLKQLSQTAWSDLARDIDFEICRQIKNRANRFYPFPGPHLTSKDLEAASAMANFNTPTPAYGLIAPSGYTSVFGGLFNTKHHEKVFSPFGVSVAVAIRHGVMWAAKTACLTSREPGHRWFGLIFKSDAIIHDIAPGHIRVTAVTRDDVGDVISITVEVGQHLNVDPEGVVVFLKVPVEEKENAA